MKRSPRYLLLVCFLALRAARAFALPPVEPAAGSWIEWDHSSDHVVSAPGDTGAAYPRAKQLSNGEILLAYHHGEALGDFGSSVTLRRSRDGGASWYKTQRVEGPGEQGFFGFCNPDFIELGDGRMMLVTAARAKAEPFSRDGFLSECRRCGLRVRFSNNYGATWGPPRMIAAGRGRVWEPSIVRLPGGELEIFYANESPSLQQVGATQCIESIRSSDDGRTWCAPTMVSEQRGCRPGMPTALPLANGHVACVQEVVGLSTSPWIADTLQGRASGYHLAQEEYDFGAAPFLAHAPDGSTLLAFHSQCMQAPGFKRLGMSWLFSQIFVQRGDAEAQNFGAASCPWPTVSPQSGNFFPSLLTMSNGTLVALASFITINPNRTTTTVVRWVRGRMLSSSAQPASNKAEPSFRRRPPADPGVKSPGAAPVSGAPVPGGDKYRYGPPPATDPEGSNRDE